MKELQESFIGEGEVRGFIFTQLQKSPTAYLYEVKVPSKETGEIIEIHYEVFSRKENVQPRLNISNVSYPKRNSFGAWAWTTSSLDRANEIFSKLNQR